MKARLFRHLVNAWPPLLFAGIRAKFISDDYCAVEVVLKLRWYNRNYVGVHYGGSLFSMTDPWYMLMLMQNLGSEYYVWDKCASIDYLSPGRGTVSAKIHIDESLLDRIRAQTATGDKYLPEFCIDIVDEKKNLVARVNRTVYVRKKPMTRRE
jgi:acyl-coenzyme A thioesterase PaaI-like protein